MFELAQMLAPIFSNAAGGAAQGKVAEQNAAATQNQNATSRYQALVNASRLQNIEQPSANMSQAGRGALMSTWKPMTVTPASVPYGSQTNGAVKPTIGGGPTITPEMRDTGDQVMRSALQRQISGNPVDASSFPSDSALGLNPLPTESATDKILKYGSMATSLLGAAGKTGLLGGKAAGAAAPYPVGSAANGGVLMSDGTVAPAAAPSASGGLPIGAGSGAPSSSWFGLGETLKNMQTGVGSAEYYRADNPFLPGGGSSAGVEDKAADLLWGRTRARAR
jgi:hypothetical protein